MKKLLAVIVVGWGAVVVYRGIDHGLPAVPHGGYEWGGIVAFGLGALAVLLGVIGLWRVLTGGAAEFGGGTMLLAMLLAAAATFGVMKWRGQKASPECVAALDHVRALAVAADPSGETVARFDARRTVMMANCQAAHDPAQLQCVLGARSFDEFQQCP